MPSHYMNLERELEKPVVQMTNYFSLKNFRDQIILSENDGV